MKKFREYLSVGLCGLVLASCNNEVKNLKLITNQPVKVCQIQNKISYKLEDLCDTELYEKDITLYVYIHPSEILWDYHKYKEEIFDYVKDFFKENQIKCTVVYSTSNFKKFNSSNEFGVEIVVSEKDVEDRFFQLVTEQYAIDGETPLDLDERGYAVTRARVALINGWEEWRGVLKIGELTKEEVERQFSESYKGMTKKDYLFKENAGLICHELLHCVGLWHLDEFDSLVKEDEVIPNIMANKLPKFKKGCSIGYTLIPLQKRLIHSFVAGNNTYKAFLDSERDLELYLKNLAEANNLELNKKN